MVILICIFNKNILLINAILPKKNEKELIPLVLKSSNMEKSVLLQEHKQDLLKNELNSQLPDMKTDKSIVTESISEIATPNILQPHLEDKSKYKDKQNDLQIKNVIGWKHDLGSLFSKKIRLFYGIDSVSAFPCASFQEWLNIKQFLLCLLENHIPKMDFLFDFLKLSGIKEEFIDDKYEKIALQTSVFYRLLKKNPSLGYFYFKKEDLKDMQTVEISFCNCQVPGYSILELISEIVNAFDFDAAVFRQHLLSYAQHLKENIHSETKEEEMNVSVNQFLNQIIHNSDIDELEHHLLFNLIKSFNKIFIPKNFTFHQHIEKTKIKPLRIMRLVLSSLSKKQILGFCLKIEKKENNNFYLCFYEIFKTKTDHQEQLQFVDQVLISDTQQNEHVFFHHLMISISQKKRLLLKKSPLLNAIKI
ncbi:hypothetical protein [Candidatus Phytoplasma phoenicium]|uniref:hypothetical protein n=1 Tax=Candidatus Phytoplasma phoenicium TaxID=198422 RepID=UPI00178CFD25|nr:hypothetical protein [Candidatus Phytoplasma phoenicium]